MNLIHSIFTLFVPPFMCSKVLNSDRISFLQRSESETQRAVQSRNKSEEFPWPQSDQDKERNAADVVETVGGERHEPNLLWFPTKLEIYLMLTWTESKTALVFTPFHPAHHHWCNQFNKSHNKLNEDHLCVIKCCKLKAAARPVSCQKLHHEDKETFQTKPGQDYWKVSIRRRIQEDFQGAEYLS